MSAKHGILSKMNARKGEADGACLREEDVGNNEVRVVDTLAGGEDGMGGRARG